MKVPKKLFLCLLSLIVGECFLANAQRTSHKLLWKQPKTLKVSTATQVKYLRFDGAVYNILKKGLPEYYETVKLHSNTSRISVELTNQAFAPLTNEEAALVEDGASLISKDIKANGNVSYERKEPYAVISFIPIRKNPITGKYEKLVSFDLDIRQIAGVHRVAATGQHYAANSVLATGNWFKIGVTKNGVYKIDYNFLKSLGMDVKSIDPRNIRVYGNGGAMLPAFNGTPRPDDLLQNAIYVKGESDGVFDSTDYVLFYGQSPNTWAYDTTDNQYHHNVNLYSDTTYYFITADLGPGKRISTQSSTSLTPTNTVTSFDDHLYHEYDNVNLIKSGSQWYGEYFDILTSYSFSFNFPNIDASSPVYVKTDMVARNSINSQFAITCIAGGTAYQMLNVPSVNTGCYYCDYGKEASTAFTFNPTGDLIKLNINKVTSSSIGWLNYIEVNARRKLIMAGDQMSFRDMRSVGPGNVSSFVLSSGDAIQVWDVTDPQNVRKQALTENGSNFQFTLPTDSLRQFIAFNGNYYDKPTSCGSVPNQNLHAMGQKDMIIVTHPDFLDQAERLADFHKTHDGFSVAVVTTDQVYNEFSSGRQDPIAIRDFVRMFYDRATSTAEMPKYLLLFGGGTYDNKHHYTTNTDFVPTYESANSLVPTSSYVSDDYYGLLDSTEGDWSTNYLIDIGVGRIPVQTDQEAKDVVTKIIDYETDKGMTLQMATSANDTTLNSSGDYNLQDWRNAICFVADDEDADLHIGQANQLASQVDSTQPWLNTNKIYFDAYQQQATPGGDRYPDVTTAIDKQVQSGALIVNYTGHGGQLGWAHERVLGISDINAWTNMNHLPLFVTATCDFSTYDNPAQVSAGEDILLNPNGGGIALLSTVRLVYSSQNLVLNQSVYDCIFKKIDGHMPRLGDIYRIAKNASGPFINNRNYTLLGDPAVRLAYPEQRVYTTAINGHTIAAGSTPSDTVSALSRITISGYVGDTTGTKLSSFNGLLYPTIYDKPKAITTLSNDGTAASPPFTFLLQKNILYKGMVSINNGNFSFTFVVPKDIAYQYGYGKISYYAENGTVDATGNEKMLIGGSATNVPNDVTGPDVKLYMNNDQFVYGGITDENPKIYAVVSDSSGINTVGNGIGHDITAILDANTEHAIVLNDYYQADLNSYQSGKIIYPLSNLSEGHHTLSLKVWDVYNNSSTAYTEFNVVNSSKLAIKHVLNYPDPFTTHTGFYFEENRAADQLNIQIQIYTVSGKLVKTINRVETTEGYRVGPINWDGKDDFGDKIARGVYLYHLKVRSQDGSTADKYEKLVILE